MQWKHTSHLLQEEETQKGKNKVESLKVIKYLLGVTQQDSDRSWAEISGYLV